MKIYDRFDASGVTDTILRALASAGLNTQSGPMKSVTDTIQKALADAGLTPRSAVASEHGATIDGIFRELDPRVDTSPSGHLDPAATAKQPARGEFLSRSFSNAAGTRTYKLYIPACHSGTTNEPVPLVVMLHGCTQSPDDFAAGTRMNGLADQHGFLVVYPAQAANANGSRCWNWFRSEDQIRDAGEPSLIAGIVREVATDFHVDRGRIFVAGMSAGAAMAVILGAAYPDLFTAVGSHSGLPFGAAHDLASAFGAMQGGLENRTGAPCASILQASAYVPTIVFHGDRDRTVDARNSTAIVEQATIACSVHPPLRASVQTGTSTGGRTYTRTDYMDAANRPIVEQWVLHGTGHAWSGGSSRGSFTDTSGPDASAEMVRFFLSQQRAGTA